MWMHEEKYFKKFRIFEMNTGKYGPEKTPYLNIFHAVDVFGANQS